MTDNGSGMVLTDERWRAIVANDSEYDGKFFYGVLTTGIFCRPSCRSKVPNRENVRIFIGEASARAVGLRPCKRCKPTGEKLPDEEWAAWIAAYIDSHLQEPLPLQKLADMCHGSPYHLQRTFKKIKGMTPMEYAQQVRIAKAEAELRDTEKSLSAIAADAGIGNLPYFITLFKKKTGFTPGEYRKALGIREGERRG